MFQGEGNKRVDDSRVDGKKRGTTQSESRNHQNHVKKAIACERASVEKKKKQSMAAPSIGCSSAETRPFFQPILLQIS